MESTQQTVTRRNRMNQGQGLAEYSLIISLVALVCVSILAVLGRGTKNTIYKVTCAAGSTDSQCSCINEKLSVTSTFPNGCSGTTLIVTVTSSCTGSSITVGTSTATTPASFSVTSAPACTTGSGTTSFAVKSTQPSGTVNNYTASRP